MNNQLILVILGCMPVALMYSVDFILGKVGNLLFKKSKNGELK